MARTRRMTRSSSKKEDILVTKKKSPVATPQDDSSSSEEESLNDDTSTSSSDANGHENDENMERTDDESESEEREEEDSNSNKGFTDENAAWLKPKSTSPKKKSQLLSSSDEESNEDDDESENKNSSDEDGNYDDDDDEEDLLEVERQSRLIDAEMEIEREEAEEELRRTISQNTSVFHLPTPEELQEEEDGNRVVPPSELRERIHSILEVLADFKNRREPNRARSEYVDVLSRDLSELYGYLPELVDYFLSMFGPTETLEFLTSSDTPRPLVIRTNTLKVRRKDLAASLLKRGVTLDPLSNWSKVGLKITASPIPIGATPEYLSGQYMLQSAASLCPVMALNPSPGEKVLDMSAAPGGKTSYVAQLMRNTGTVIANDLKPDRQKATVANLHRLGVKNVVTCAYDGRKLGALWKNKFDKILLDAPCSGLGVISRDPSVKVQRTVKDVERCGVLQKELLLSAIDALNFKGKGGGIIVYSTCSVSVTENEEVVNYLLSKRDVKILPAGLDFGKPGFTRYQQKRFHPSLALTRRFYPHVHNMDGFYVAKIQKLSDKRPGEEVQPNFSESTKERKLDETTTGHEEKASSDNDIDWEARVKKELAKKKKEMEPDQDKIVVKGKSDSINNVSKKGKNKKNKKGQKRGSNNTGDKDSNEFKKQKRGANAISIPPTKMGENKKQKKSNSAKVTKPRRRKQEQQQAEAE